MWKQSFNDLTELRSFLTDNINLSEDGFTFCKVSCGTDIQESAKTIGNPTFINVDDESQQTIKYVSLINHPEHGTRDHHNLSLLLWAFNREPIKILKLHFSYFDLGVSKEFVKELIEGIVNKINHKPTKKTLSKGRAELNYLVGKSRFLLWQNNEGIRIQIQYVS